MTTTALERRFVFPHATVDWTPEGAVTTLKDGRRVVAEPERTPDYSARARRLGYGNSILSMCQEHELLHALFGELVTRSGSPVMYALAGDDIPRRIQGDEERLVIDLQAWINRNWRGGWSS